MSEIFEHKLSLLMDGEITPFETKRLVDEMHSNANFKSLWLRMNKHRAAMHGELLDPNLDLSQNIMSQINNLPSSETNNINKWPNLNLFSLNYMKVCCYLIGFFFISAVQILMLGILGEYISVTLSHTRSLPLVVEKERINF